MRDLEKELINYLFDRKLVISNDKTIDAIVGFIKQMTNDSKPDMPYQIEADLEQLFIKYDSKLINHRSGMIPLIDQAIEDYESNVKYLKELLRLA